MQPKRLPCRFDAPWKFTIHEFLAAFLQTLFPEVARKVDWRQPVRFRDSQLERLFPHGGNGDLRADMLLEVPLLDYDEVLLLLHVEVQSQPDPGLALRMYRYHYRIFDKHGRHPLGLVVLADTDPGWRPGPYIHGKHGPRVTAEYLSCKVLDLDVGPWLAARNPVAWVIEAHRRAQKTMGDDVARREAKLSLMEELAVSGMGSEEMAKLMRPVHCLLALPEDLEEEVMEQFPHMKPYMADVIMSPFEAVLWRKMNTEVREKAIAEGRQEGRKEGREEGREEGRTAAARDLLMDVLRERFGRLGRGLPGKVALISDEAELRRLTRIAVRAPSLEAFVVHMKRA